MAVGIAAATIDTMLDAGFAAPLWVEVHSASPGSSGLLAPLWRNAGVPVRKPLTLSASSGGVKTSITAAQVWSAGEVNHVGTIDPTFITIWGSATSLALSFFRGDGALAANPQATGVSFTIPIGNITVILAQA